MIEAALEAALTVLEPSRLAWMVAGVSVGLLVGILPGLGGTVGMSILVPFVFGMDPYNAVAMLIGMAAVTSTSDTFPSVLLGIPGSAGSQATIMDGYPLARQGKSAEALGAAFAVSLAGGLLGAFALLGTLSIARPLVLALGSPELFMLALLGLTTVGIVARGSFGRGMIAGLLGMAIGAVGAAPAVTVYRYSFGWDYLYDGIPIAVLALGLFAIPELIHLFSERQRISQEAKVEGRMRDGFSAAWKNRVLVLRSALLGNVLGMIPGVGGSVIDWIAYGSVGQPKAGEPALGEGNIRGVIAPESANNAKEGGSLVPTLLFGIPGSGTTAVLLGAFVLMGVQPGPNMVGRELPLTLAIIWTLAIANVVGAGACLLLTRPISKIALVPAERLFPLVLIVVVVASYQSTRHWGDILVMLGLGVLGQVMKNLGWPRAPILIGFVLALPAERYLHLSMSRYGMEWLTRGGVMAIAAIVLLVAVVGVRGRKPGARARRVADDEMKEEERGRH